jgi:hypothetical protein
MGMLSNTVSRRVRLKKKYYFTADKLYQSRIRLMLSSLLRATEDNGCGSGSVLFHGILVFRAVKRCAHR